MKRILISFIRVIVGFPLNLVYIIACLVPKDRDLWLFSAWNGRRFIDNPKYIYKYLLKNKPEIRVVWVARDKKLFKSMRAQKLPVVYAWGFSGVIHQLRAGVVVFTHSVDWDYTSAIIGYQVKRIQTWHGMPIKKIGYDDMRDRSAQLKLKISKWVTPFKVDRFDLVIAGSEEDKSKYQSAFNVLPEKVRITGYPRNDEIVRATAKKNTASRKRIIYMPTYRGAVGSEFRLLDSLGFDYLKADGILEEIEGELFIKLHPAQVFAQLDLEKMARCRNIKPLFNDADIYEQIGFFDILITDYSGIYFDFLITSKPIIMAPFDLDDYKIADRELYYSYEDICPDPPCFTWDEVFFRLRQITKYGGIDRAKYKNLQEKFHRHMDDRSSERAAEEIAKLTGLVSN
mgnify:FL=1